MFLSGFANVQQILSRNVIIMAVANPMCTGVPKIRESGIQHGWKTFDKPRLSDRANPGLGTLPLLFRTSKFLFAYDRPPFSLDSNMLTRL